VFHFRRRAPDAPRFRALRELYRSFLREDTAEERGRRLLKDWLSLEQRRQFEAFGYFEVVGCDTGKRYRIRYGASTNVEEIDAAGKSKMGWCFVPKGYLVPGDVMLAQKIALETSERAALAVANRFTPMPSAARENRRPF
jgi:hypothetical protein